MTELANDCMLQPAGMGALSSQKLTDTTIDNLPNRIVPQVLPHAAQWAVCAARHIPRVRTPLPC
jgi:hypothetical protein